MDTTFTPHNFRALIKGLRSDQHFFHFMNEKFNFIDFIDRHQLGNFLQRFLHFIPPNSEQMASSNTLFFDDRGCNPLPLYAPEKNLTTVAMQAHSDMESQLRVVKKCSHKN